MCATKLSDRVPALVRAACVYRHVLLMCSEQAHQCLPVATCSLARPAHCHANQHSKQSLPAGGTQDEHRTETIRKLDSLTKGTNQATGTKGRHRPTWFSFFFLTPFPAPAHLHPLPQMHSSPAGSTTVIKTTGRGPRQRQVAWSCRVVSRRDGWVWPGRFEGIAF